MKTVKHSRACLERHLGTWAVEPNWARNRLAEVKAGLVRAMEDDHDPAERAQREDRMLMADGAHKVVRDENYRLLYTVSGGVGVVRIDGLMQKFDGKYTGTNTTRARKAMRQAADDPDAGELLMLIDSPGGSVEGTMELAAEVRRADEKKRVRAYIEDLGASAAYWVASQAEKISTNEMGLIGSIGTYAVLYDESKAAEMAGVQVHVLSTGKMKGAGEPGTKLSDEYLGYVQGLVDDFNAKFLDGVKEGRGLDAKAVKALATGEVWIAPKAKKLGLVDEVSTYEDVLAEAQERVAKRARARGAAAKLSLAELEK